jgi:hypothetical protein
MVKMYFLGALINCGCEHLVLRMPVTSLDIPFPVTCKVISMYLPRLCHSSLCEMTVVWKVEIMSAEVQYQLSVFCVKSVPDCGMF